MSAPYFFLSHARQHVKRFHADLAQAVRELAREHEAAIETIDSEPAAGDRWTERILRGLSDCRAFVALYSVEYFAAEHCGKEWQAFADRRPSSIIPVPWQPVSAEAMPSCAREIRALKLSPTCERYGLAYLLRHLPEHRTEYEAAVYAVARRVVALAERGTPVRTDRVPEYADVRNAFADGTPGRRRPRMRILIAAPATPKLPVGADPDMYGPSPGDWRPYIPEYGGQIALAARRLVESMDFDVFVEPFGHSAEERANAAPTAPALLVIDPWALLDPVLHRRLSGFDTHSDTKPWIRPVVVWRRDNPYSKNRGADIEARLRASLRQCRLRYRPDAPRVLDGLETIRDFRTELPAVVRRAERLYLSRMARDRRPGFPIAEGFPR
jgi:FxsC-like protein